MRWSVVLMIISVAAVWPSGVKAQFFKDLFDGDLLGLSGLISGSGDGDNDDVGSGQTDAEEDTAETTTTTSNLDVLLHSTPDEEFTFEPDEPRENLKVEPDAQDGSTKSTSAMYITATALVVFVCCAIIYVYGKRRARQKHATTSSGIRKRTAPDCEDGGDVFDKQRLTDDWPSKAPVIVSNGDASAPVQEEAPASKVVAKATVRELPGSVPQSPVPVMRSKNVDGSYTTIEMDKLNPS